MADSSEKWQMLLLKRCKNKSCMLSVSLPPSDGASITHQPGTHTGAPSLPNSGICISTHLFTTTDCSRYIVS